MYLCLEVEYLLKLNKTEILVNSIDNCIYRERLLELKKKQFYRKMQKEKEESGEDGLLKQIDGKLSFPPSPVCHHKLNVQIIFEIRKKISQTRF